MTGTQCPKCGRWMTSYPDHESLDGESRTWMGTQYCCEKCGESIYVERGEKEGGEQLEYLGKIKVFGSDDQQVTLRTDGSVQARKITLDAPRAHIEIFDIEPKERERR